MASIVVSNIEKAEGFESDFISGALGQGSMESKVHALENKLGKKIGIVDSETGETKTNGADSSAASASSASALRTMQEDLILPFCVSLGPADGVFAQNSGLFGGSIVAEGK